MENSLCSICGNKIVDIDFSINQSVSSDAKLINHPISHSMCKKCGYVSVNIENRVDYKAFYKTDYDFLLDGDVEPSIGETTYSDSLVDFFSEFIKNEKGKTFFDIGAGKGNFIESVHNRFLNLFFIALEPSKSFTKLKKKDYINELHYEFFNSKKFKSKYDYLSLIGVLEHVENPKEFLLDIKKIMHKNSMLLIEVPNFNNNKADLLTIDHLSKFTEESLINLFNTTGFDVLKKQTLSIVPMQFIVKISDLCKVENINNNINVKKAVEYLNKVFQDAKKLKNEKIAIYGQGLVMEYLLGTGDLNLNNITCIIDDNSLYQGKHWKNKLPIIDFFEFKEHYNTKKIFLAMNDCYHKKVLKKLDQFEVYGVS